MTSVEDISQSGLPLTVVCSFTPLLRLPDTTRQSIPYMYGSFLFGLFITLQLGIHVHIDNF